MQFDLILSKLHSVVFHEDQALPFLQPRSWLHTLEFQLKGHGHEVQFGSYVEKDYLQCQPQVCHCQQSGHLLCEAGPHCPLVHHQKSVLLPESRGTLELVLLYPGLESALQELPQSHLL